MSGTIMAYSSSKLLHKTAPLPTTKLIPSHHNYVVSASSSVSSSSPTTASPPHRFQKVMANIPGAQLVVKSASAAALAAAVVVASPLPVLAADIEKAALFDFNLTLPAIAAEFLFLMVALDKIYFTPLGKFMDERDAAIREKLGDVKDTSTEVKQLEEQASAVVKAARAEISAALNQMKKETSGELELKLAEGRKKVEAELAEALQNLEKQKEETIKALDSQIAALSDEIVKKVLPTA